MFFRKNTALFHTMALALAYSLITLLLLVQSVPYSATAQTSTNKSLGSSLTAQNKDSYWASLSRDFAFGFQQIGKGGYLLAIWFNNIPEKTVVWSANGNNLAPRGSVVQLTADGQLLLNDPTGKQIWRANWDGSEVAYGAMLDSGNFVLARQDSHHLWQSFDHPTDTILPTQIMNKNSQLVARYAERNYSNGRFQFTLKLDGNLVLEARAFPLNSSSFAYWSSETAGTGFQVVFDQSGSLYVSGNSGSILKNISEPTSSPKYYYHRAILEYDGVFRHYLYRKSTTTADAGNWLMPIWSPSSSFIPSNICSIGGETAGSGACGFNSYCKLGDYGRRSCHCPNGYTFIDPDDVMKGCKQNFISQSCDEETDNFDFHRMPNTDWPWHDYEHFQGQTEVWCKKACLVDCFCAAAIYRNGECWKKKIPLSNGRMDLSVRGSALIKFRKDNSTLNPSSAGRSTLLLSSSVFLNLLLLLAAFLVIFRLNYWKQEVLQVHQVMPGINLQSFTYEELRKATNGFKEELGRGAFATVYKGSLESDDIIHVAVKRLNNMVRQSDLEFKAELSAIGRTNHRNLVQLLGFCNEGEHRLLVYEFMSYGSVASLLFGGNKECKLRWDLQEGCLTCMKSAEAGSYTVISSHKTSFWTRHGQLEFLTSE
ncbi:G-type lectin S-receptor-like serine/threonine-protein kinase LECRK3 isoform X2 [Alnus glutinosa]|uniref:G-type lectin S-receptor-like serine/threonine-protein kinase LECRK3 isoform X2 n=1 Tax=Alnus glutinosa TaxID=3517 RepID=UPI002D78CD1B|nr:G-type lectin S-receptor-like serine/threonine-protein kinase LECRK3 isoform X2 [Alnus glutinosa]